MNSTFRVRFAWYVIASAVAGPLLPARAALLVASRLVRAERAGDLYKS